MQKLRSREMVHAADEALVDDTANVQLDSLEMDNGRSVGCERLALEALESLRFSEALKNVGMSDRDARITMAMVIARMVHPSNERAALNWLETNSATLELLRLDTGKGLKLALSSQRCPGQTPPDHRRRLVCPPAQAVRHWRRGDFL